MIISKSIKKLNAIFMVVFCLNNSPRQLGLFRFCTEQFEPSDQNYALNKPELTIVTIERGFHTSGKS